MICLRIHRQDVRGRPVEGWRAAARPALALCLIAQVASPACAQTAELRPAIETSVGVTDNGGGAPSAQARKDAIALVRPTLHIAADSRLLKFRALLGADLIAYANGTQPNRAFPRVLADGTGTLVERLLFLDASASVRAAERDPYAARSEAGSTQNREVTSVYRLSPYLNWDLSSASNLFARVEEITARGDAGSATNQRFTNADLRWSTRPLPWGGRIEYESHAVRFSVPADSTVTIRTLKASGDVALGGEFVVGPSVGVERIAADSDTQTEGYYGAHFTWSPSERTQLAAEAARRFFGTGWKLELHHRAPWATLSVDWERAPVTRSQSLGVVDSANGLNAFLDAILTTRYPDPTARSSVVSGLVANRGLQPGAQGAIDVRANYAQVQNNFNASVVFLGARNIASFGVYVLTLRGLAREADLLGSAVPAASDSRQIGASVEFNRRLTPQLTVDLTSMWSRISGLEDAAGQSTSQQSHRLAFVRAVSPRTAVSIGFRHDALRSNLAVVQSYAANSAFVGMNHKF